MRPGRARSSDPPLGGTHRLQAADFDALARGRGGATAVAALRAAELSRHLLLLRAAMDLAIDTRPRLCHALALRQSYDLLAEAQRLDPEATEAVLRQPHVGAWLARCLRRLRGREAPGAGGSPRADLAHLGGVAAAAAIRAGLDFEVVAGAHGGAVMLPTLGLALLGAGPAGTAVVRRAGGRVSVTAAGTGIALPPRLDGDAPGWLALRRLRSTAGGRRLEVILDDLDPFRERDGLPVAGRLDPGAVEAWQRALDDAWALLAAHHPHHAEALEAGLVSLVPLAGGRHGAAMSATSGEAFGAVMLTPPADGTSLAVTLVHEFQHHKLGALLGLFPLYREAGEAGEPLHYAPWRGDPRPLGALLQGTYAFLGVTDFWRVQRTVAGAGTAPLAEFEFARWREHTWRASGTLAGSGRLTELGERFVAGMRSALRPLLVAPVPAEPLALAGQAVLDDDVSWRLRNLRPDGALVGRLLDAWATGAPRPPLDLAPATVVPPPGGRRPQGGARLRLAHLRLKRPDRFAELAATAGAGGGAGGTTGGETSGEAEGETSGATSGATSGEAGSATGGETGADWDLVRGDHAAAAGGYRAAIAADPDRQEPWAGLALARQATGPEPVAAILRTHPELVYALHRQARLAGLPAPDPDGLAAWLATGG